MLAGGFGGTTGDMMMHSLDTVKTRQQGDPHIPPKYTRLGSSYFTIWRQEGVRRGLYGGVLPAFLGSYVGTVLFFGSYEWSKRLLLDAGVNPSVSYLAGGKCWPTCLPGGVLTTFQVSLPTSSQLLSMCPLKSSRRAFSFKDATTTRSSRAATTTAQRGMPRRQLCARRALGLFSTVSKQLFTEIFRTLPCNLRSGSRNKTLHAPTSEKRTLACLWRFSREQQLAVWPASSRAHLTLSKPGYRRKLCLRLNH